MVYRLLNASVGFAMGLRDISKTIRTLLLKGPES